MVGWVGIRIDETKLERNKLELKGRRIRSIYDAKTGALESFPTNEKMEVKVNFKQSPLDQTLLKKALDQIFLTKDDKLDQLIALSCQTRSPVKAPRAIFAPDPSYTDDARQRKIQGIVKLWIIVNDAGIVTDVEYFLNGTVLLDITLQSISHESSFALRSLSLSGFDKRPACKKSQLAESERGYEYPSERVNSQGAVAVVAGTIDQEGQVGQVELQQSSAEDVDAKLLLLAKNLKPRSAKCDGRAIPSFFRMYGWPTKQGKIGAYLYSFLDNE